MELPDRVEDPLLLHDFFEGDYTANPQPNTFVEANKYWDNWSLDALTTPRVNDFFNQVERLPDVKLTARTVPTSIMPPRAPTRSSNCSCRKRFSAG